VSLPWADLAGRSWHLRDVLSGADFDRAGDELQGDGLYVEMRPWEPYFLALSA
jgi:hypothetical protein